MSAAMKTVFANRVITWGDKISKARMGHPVSEETRKKIGLAGIGRKPSEVTKRRISQAEKGEKHWQWKGGKPRCEKCGITLSNYHNKLCSTCISGEFHDERNGMWKGDKVGYDALHDWVKRRLGRPTKCEHCGTDGLTGKQIHWANKSGEYLRDLSDWLRLCKHCHDIYDGKVKK